MKLLECDYAWNTIIYRLNDDVIFDFFDFLMTHFRNCETLNADGCLKVA